MVVRRLLKQISKNYVNQQVMYLLVSFSNSSLSLCLYSGSRGAFYMRPIGEAAVWQGLRADMESAPTIALQ
jgi:hypothetical protein